MENEKNNRVYKYHLQFLNVFPQLNDWLLINGFSVNYSHRDFASGIIYTYWSDRTSQEDGEADKAANNFIVVYNEKSNSVEIFHGETMLIQSSEKNNIEKLNELLNENVNEDFDSPSSNDHSNWDFP